MPLNPDVLRTIEVVVPVGFLVLGVLTYGLIRGVDTIMGIADENYEPTRPLKNIFRKKKKSGNT